MSCKWRHCHYGSSVAVLKCEKHVNGLLVFHVKKRMWNGFLSSFLAFLDFYNCWHQIVTMSEVKETAVWQIRFQNINYIYMFHLTLSKSFNQSTVPSVTIRPKSGNGGEFIIALCRGYCQIWKWAFCNPQQQRERKHTVAVAPRTVIWLTEIPNNLHGSIRNTIGRYAENSQRYSILCVCVFF